MLLVITRELINKTKNEEDVSSPELVEVVCM